MDDGGDTMDDGLIFGIAGIMFVWNTGLWFGFIHKMVWVAYHGEEKVPKFVQFCVLLVTLLFVGAGLAVPAAVGGPVVMAIAYPPIVIAIIYILYKNPKNPITQALLHLIDSPPELNKAAYNGDLITCRRLLEEGKADLNAVNKVGATALHSAFFFHNGLDDWRTNVATDEKVARAIAKFEIAQLLIDMGASTRAVDALGKTPIEVAPDAFACARAGLLEPMKMMLRLTGANEMTQTPNRNTLLHAAALCSLGKWSESKVLAPTAVDGKCNCARYLLSHGLSPDSPNDAGMTARRLCTSRIGPVYAKMLAVIDSYGAEAITPPQAAPAMVPQVPMGMQMMKVIVPPDVASGQMFVIQTPSGQQMQVAVPPGVSSGQQIEVAVPEAVIVATAIDVHLF